MGEQGEKVFLAGRREDGGQPTQVLKEAKLPRASTRNLRLAEQLIETSKSDRFDFSDYEDKYLDKVHELIDAKVKGREIVAPPEPEKQPEVLSLMDALRKSVEKARPNGKPRHHRGSRGRRAS